MSLTKEAKQEIIKKYQTSSEDVGSPQVQVAILTKRISNLTEHLKQNKKDVHTRRGLTNMVARRRKLLSYLKRINLEEYQKLLLSLSIRHS